METIRIQGGTPLHGKLAVQGSKNAALPIMAASILVPGVTVLENCPEISDTACMCELLESVGARVCREGRRVIINASSICSCQLPRKLVTRMRSSVILLGALLGRCKMAQMHYPGGWVIGERPVDLHVKALQVLGAKIEERDEMLIARTAQLTGGDITLPFPSVGATQNALLASVLAKGKTRITGCAKEPEIAALAAFLNGAGARVYGAGTSCIEVEGTESLRESVFTIPADRIVAGTYLIGTMVAGGQICLENAPAEQMKSLIECVQKMGVKVTRCDDGHHVCSQKELRSPGKMETAVYPGFPTDLQSQMLVALCRAKGPSCLRERVFNARFGVAEELEKMGAAIRIEKDSAYIAGGSSLHGACVTARELRGGAALVLAGLCAEGVTDIQNRQFIDRGYEDICKDLRKLGAKIG